MKTIAETNQEVNETAVFAHGDKPCNEGRLPGPADRSRSLDFNSVFHPLTLIVILEIINAKDENVRRTSTSVRFLEGEL